jgi:hypothetical protein
MPLNERRGGFGIARVCDTLAQALVPAGPELFPLFFSRALKFSSRSSDLFNKREGLSPIRQFLDKQGYWY